MARHSDAGKQYKCELCDRTFRMAPHLGRHMATTHAPASKRKTRAGRRPRGHVGHAPARTQAGFNGPAASIRKFRDALVMQREQLDRQIASLDRALAALGER